MALLYHELVSLIVWPNDSTACERLLFDLSGPVRYRSFACHIVSYGRAINNWATLSLKYPRPTISREVFTYGFVNGGLLFPKTVLVNMNHCSHEGLIYLTGRNSTCARADRRG